MKEKVYLIGQISTKYEITYAWRKKVKELLKNSNNCEIIDPCDNGFNLNRTNFNNDKSKVIDQYDDKGINLIVNRDYNYVIKSSGCIADLNVYDENKPIIGTLFELAWYRSHPEKCVIGIFDGNRSKDIYCNHPFVKNTVTCWCKTHEEAAYTYLNYYNEGKYE